MRPSDWTLANKLLCHWLGMTRALERRIELNASSLDLPVHRVRGNNTAGPRCQHVYGRYVPYARHPPVTVSARSDPGGVHRQHRVQRGTEGRAHWTVRHEPLQILRPGCFCVLWQGTTAGAKLQPGNFPPKWKTIRLVSFYCSSLEQISKASCHVTCY